MVYLICPGLNPSWHIPETIRQPCDGVKAVYDFLFPTIGQISRTSIQKKPEFHLYKSTKGHLAFQTRDGECGEAGDLLVNATTTNPPTRLWLSDKGLKRAR